MDPDLYKVVNKARLGLMHGKKSLVVYRDGKMAHHSDERGMTGLFNLVTSEPEIMKNAVVGDKIVGLAAAYLCIHAQVKAVFAMIISEEAIELLQKHQILPTWQTTVAYIVERDLSSRYKLDLQLAGVNSVTEAVERIRDFLSAVPREAGD